ncbi:MAG: HEAT repeat domain-containing protein [Chloroflexota bacterium]
MNRLASLLKIRSGEWLMVLLVGLLFACIQAGQGMGDNAASALFLLRFGVDYLPTMYLFLGLLTFGTTLAYSAGLGRFERNRFFLYLILGLIGVLVLERIALATELRFLYPVLWLTINSMGMILGTLTWNVAGEVCDARQGKRLFPLFASAGILGSVLGNLITGGAARLLGTANLLLLYALLLGGVYFLMRIIATKFFQPVKKSGKPVAFWEDLRTGFDYVRGSSLIRLVALASILFSILFFAIAFPFSKVVTVSFAGEEQVAGFFGLFNSLTTAVTFLASLFLANRVYARVGIVNSVLLMPLTYIFGFAVFGISYSLSGGIIARFAQLVVLGGIAGTAWNALFNVVPSQKRGQVLAFNNGVPSQIGVMLSGLLLIVAENYLSVRQVFLIGALVALLCIFLMWRMRAAYAQALIDALRAGRLEVFTAGEAAFTGLQLDAAALRVATEALQDAKPSTRRLAAQMLARMRATSAIPALRYELFDPDPEVRVAVLEALESLGATAALDEIVTQLDEPDERVRKQSLAVIAKFAPPLSPALSEKLTQLLNHDPSIAVQAQAARTLSVLGAGERAIPELMIWLYSKETELRRAALETLGEAARHLKIPLESKPLLTALEDPAPAIRRAAALGLAGFQEASVNKALITLLSDPDETVRSAVVHALRERGDEACQSVMEIFETDDPAIDAALDVLAAQDASQLSPLREYVRRESLHLKTLRSQRASLPPSGRAVSFLRDCLGRQVSKVEGRLIKAVGLFGDMQTMELVRKSINASNPENRAAALEALETIGDKQLAKDIVTLLEEEPAPMDSSNVIGDLLTSKDAWLRILAVRAAPELGLRVFIPVLHRLKSERDPLLQEAALAALCDFGEVPPMDTLNTVSILERILLLREIPIFADLSPEDLKRVAEITREEWYPQNTVIFRQGDEGNLMLVIVEGVLKIMRTANGIEQVLARRGPGEFVGEMAVIESAPRSATLITQSDVRVLSLDAGPFKSILHERPEVSFAVLRSISRRLREMTE